MTGFLISMGSVVAIIAGLVVFVEGKKIKKIEGIPVEEEEVEEDAEKARGSSAPPVAVDNNNDEKEMPHLTRTRTEKTKGKHWYERY